MHYFPRRGKMTASLSQMSAVASLHTCWNRMGSQTVVGMFIDPAVHSTHREPIYHFLRDPVFSDDNVHVWLQHIK